MALMLGCGSDDGVAGDDGAAELTAPSEELYAALMKPCLESHGYAVDLLPDGGIGVEYGPDGLSPDQQAELRAAYDVRFAECLSETGFDRPSGVTPEEDYRMFVAVDDCIRAQGYDIVTPSFEDFVQGRFPDNSAILPASPSELDALFAQCER